MGSVKSRSQEHCIETFSAVRSRLPCTLRLCAAMLKNQRQFFCLFRFLIFHIGKITIRPLTVFINSAMFFDTFTIAKKSLTLKMKKVIKQMNSLEDKLGFKLFNRTNHGITLTPAAGILCREAKILTERFNTAV